ncbi:hypothetical protein OsI_12558 [Oryza sativa Indica Group]|uniref:Uncharacterized protein n=1 Tax=Oryza sativa subsp. indica TaxID=39946 RepID=A2XJD6_ORYSI|nr:hypothetical protein OsI_12558 [Oryza sativa Indica Group]
MQCKEVVRNHFSSKQRQCQGQGKGVFIVSQRQGPSRSDQIEHSTAYRAVLAYGKQGKKAEQGRYVGGSSTSSRSKYIRLRCMARPGSSGMCKLGAVQHSARDQAQGGKSETCRPGSGRSAGSKHFSVCPFYRVSSQLQLAISLSQVGRWVAGQQPSPCRVCTAGKRARPRAQGARGRWAWATILIRHVVMGIPTGKNNLMDTGMGRHYPYSSRPIAIPIHHLYATVLVHVRGPSLY